MLDTLRRNVRRLSWTLWLVIASFVVFFGPDLMSWGSTPAVARVNGDPILMGEYRQALSDQMDFYRNMNPGQELTDDLIEQLQLERVVLEQLIRRRLLVAAAEDQGFAIAPQEIKDRIMQYPVFRTESGRWIGDVEYLNILRRNGLDPAQFEESVVEDLLVERMTGLITEGLGVSDAELQELFQRDNEQVRLDFVQVRPTAFELDVRDTISEERLRAHYDDDPEAYRLPEQRRVSYALIDTEAIRDATSIDDEAIGAEYEASIAEFTVDEQVKARQILFRVPPAADEAQRTEARERAEAALARLEAGEDFAALAEELSDDPSATAGGDLGWVTRGRQVEGFDEAAFELEAGETSDVVETTFGFHLILVEDRREAEVRPLEEVRGQLEQRLAWERAEARAEELSNQIRRQVLSGVGLEQLAEEHELEIEESPLFAQSSGFGGFTSAAFTDRAFSLGEGRVAEPVRVRRGYLVFRVDEIAAPHTPPFEEVRDRVLQDVAQVVARERAEEAAAEYAERLRAGEELATIAAEASSVVESSEMINREGYVPQLGRAPQLVDAAIEVGQGGAGGPVEVGDRYVVFRVVEHVQPDWTAFAANKNDLREQELGDRRNRLFEAFLNSLRNEYTVRIYETEIDPEADHTGHAH